MVAATPPALALAPAGKPSRGGVLVCSCAAAKPDSLAVRKTCLHFALAVTCRSWSRRASVCLGRSQSFMQNPKSGRCWATGPGKKFSPPDSDGYEEMDDYIDPAKQEPPEAVDEEEGLTKFDRVTREVGRARQKEEEKYPGMKPVFYKSLGLDEQGNVPGTRPGEEEDQLSREVIRVHNSTELSDSVREDLDDRRVGPRKERNGGMRSLRGAAIDAEEEEDVLVDVDGDGNVLPDDLLEEDDIDLEPSRTVSLDPSFDLNFEAEVEDEEEEELPEPTYRMILSELLDEARVTPISVEGDLDVEITGIQHDSREVNPGDVFVCCTGFSTDGHSFTAQAVERGATVIVATQDVSVSDAVKAVVIVENSNSILSALAGAFYTHPSQKLTVVGITGTNGKTTTSYLLRSMYECMGYKTGLLGTINYYITNAKKLEAPNTTPDAVYLQKLMASMVHHGSKVCVMEVSSHALALDRCKDVDFDVALFTNLTRDHLDFHKTLDEYKEAKGRLFAKMVDPTRHRKVVNIDDPHASYFTSLGSPDVPVVTFGQENSAADVFPLEIQLSLFETELLVRTPKGNVEISSGLLGRHNVYNILAAVATGIAVNAPLEEIVRGIEEVDAVPGRCELIDEEQAFAVVVDYAHTPDALSRLLDTIRECGPRRIITGIGSVHVSVSFWTFLLQLNLIAFCLGVVIGCGGDRDRGKRPLMAKIATDKSEVTILTSDNPRTEDACMFFLVSRQSLLGAV